jgi:hypothetical protein
MKATIDSRHSFCIGALPSVFRPSRVDARCYTGYGTWTWSLVLIWTRRISSIDLHQRPTAALSTFAAHRSPFLHFTRYSNPLLFSVIDCIEQGGLRLERNFSSSFTRVVGKPATYVDGSGRGLSMCIFVTSSMWLNWRNFVFRSTSGRPESFLLSIHVFLAHWTSRLVGRLVFWRSEGEGDWACTLLKSSFFEPGMAVCDFCIGVVLVDARKEMTARAAVLRTMTVSVLTHTG